MKNRKFIYIFLISLIILVLMLLVIILQIKDDKLKVIFLNVGQGDSILIMQGSQQILIDGGKDGKLLLEKLGKFIPFWDRNIEMIAPSHPDQDHIGGLIAVLNSYGVKTILRTNAETDSETFKELIKVIGKNETREIEATKNLRIIFPNGAEAQVLYPLESLPHSIDQNTNEHSVVMRLIFGQKNFLFTGDLPSTSEAELLANNIDLKADVLKVGHHGSKYSTSEEFLNAVNPREAIISVGKNSYGHPNQEVLQRIFKHKISVLRTDEIGDIVYECQKANDKCSLVNN